jgi:hypothetical protein
VSLAPELGVIMSTEKNIDQKIAEWKILIAQGELAKAMLQEIEIYRGMCLSLCERLEAKPETRISLEDWQDLPEPEDPIQPLKKRKYNKLKNKKRTSRPQ